MVNVLEIIATITLLMFLPRDPIRKARYKLSVRLYNRKMQ